MIKMPEKLKKSELKVTGMHCAACAVNLKKALNGLEGVSEADVSIGTESAVISFDPEKTDINKINETVKRSGYGLLEDEIKIKIGGMHCAACSAAVKESLMKTEGVTSADVNLLDNSAYVKFIPGAAGEENFKSAVERAGFAYEGPEEERRPDIEEVLFKKEQKERLLRVFTGIGTAILIMALMYLPAEYPLPLKYILFVIATPVFIYLSVPIFRAAFSGLRNRNLNMDVMYALGIGVSYAASFLGTFGILLNTEYLFYETPLMLAGFLTLGRYLEAGAKGKTGTAIKKLISLRPESAFVKKNDHFEEIPVESVISGDLVMIKPGSRIPVDGTVLSGEAYVDESVITGEPLPVRKTSGNNVIGGTVLTAGSFLMTAEKVGKDTMLSQIIRTVEDMQRAKPPVQRIADRVVAWFIPAILTIATLSALVWYFVLSATPLFSMTVFISVIVIACPCALGLATPTAVTVGIGRGAELGILIRNSEALEVSEKIRNVIFDKTGTLTTGKPTVTEIFSSGIDEDELLALLAGAETGSEHPLAGAIVSFAESKGIKPAAPENFRSVSGGGIEALADGREVTAGNEQFTEDNGFIIPPEIKENLNRIQGEGMTTVIITTDRKVTGIIGISDSLKPGAFGAVKMIKDMGASVSMITGDNALTALAVGRKAGIEDIHANVLPGGKAEKVKEIKKSSGFTAFVGDGINDAPALAASDVGIAVGSGTEIAIESADIVLMRDDLYDVGAAIQLSRKVMSRIKLNLFWAFAYNSALIPVAAGVLYPLYGITFRPEFAGAAMMLSSVTVISLSLLLKNYTPEAVKEGRKIKEKRIKD
ncbi:heavy metal translocating P-type ATPase [Methanoplanus limicola]|nr:heavy metal translocating P-type ATPase [Methanoplanus limicola]